MESNPSNKSSAVPIIVGGVIAILVCCACVLIFAAGWFIYSAYQNIPTDLPTQIFPQVDPSTPQPAPTLDRTPTDSISVEAIDILNQTLIPENDPYDLACRLQAVCDVARTVPGKSYKQGDKEKFWILNSDTIQHHQTDATLLYITPHTYFWAEDGIKVDEGDMKRLMDTFENKIYPTDREFFGNEWNPGVDEDPHIFVIYAGDLGNNVAGYYSPPDEYNSLVHEYSNVHETYVLNVTQDLADEYTYATLAHEFVHMIQFATDQNDDTWLTEGFAEVGAFLNDYGVGGWDWAYAENPDLQLTDWLGGGESNGTHYGQSFLYLAYFLDRFGEEATKALNNNPKNGLTSVDDTLMQLDIKDPQTGRIIIADDVFMDWATALYLKDGNVGDGRYTYHNYPDAPQTTDTDNVSECPQSPLPLQVNQYGIDYIKIECTGDFTLRFTGSTISNLLPTDAHSGDYFFWSNKGDESNMTLTREFDFTNVNGSIQFDYSAWYAVEKDWDYLYIEASTDGETWEILNTPSGTDYDPSGNSYGWGYTGSTDDWIEENVDLSQYAGKKVQIRFEYVTDAAVHGGGFLLDDLRIDAINYQSDFETDDGGWIGNGFVRIKNVLPQNFRLALVIKGDSTTVTQIPLNPDQTAEIPLSLKSGETATLIVTGVTRFTRLPASYQIEIK